MGTSRESVRHGKVKELVPAQPDQGKSPSLSLQKRSRGASAGKRDGNRDRAWSERNTGAAACRAPLTEPYPVSPGLLTRQERTALNRKRTATGSRSPRRTSIAPRTASSPSLSATSATPAVVPSRSCSRLSASARPQRHPHERRLSPSSIQPFVCTRTLHPRGRGGRI